MRDFWNSETMREVQLLALSCLLRSLIAPFFNVLGLIEVGMLSFDVCYTNVVSCRIDEKEVFPTFT